MGYDQETTPIVPSSTSKRRLYGLDASKSVNNEKSRGQQAKTTIERSSSCGQTLDLSNSLSLSSDEQSSSQQVRSRRMTSSTEDALLDASHSSSDEHVVLRDEQSPAQHAITPTVPSSSTGEQVTEVNSSHSVRDEHVVLRDEQFRGKKTRTPTVLSSSSPTGGQRVTEVDASRSVSDEHVVLRDKQSHGQNWRTPTLPSSTYDARRRYELDTSKSNSSSNDQRSNLQLAKALTLPSSRGQRLCATDVLKSSSQHVRQGSGQQAKAQTLPLPCVRRLSLQNASTSSNERESSHQQRQESRSPSISEFVSNTPQSRSESYISTPTSSSGT